MTSSRLAELRRYPVKSMGGEALGAVEVSDRGLAGDRWFAVEDGDGRFASGKDTRRFRRRDAVFEYGASSMGGTVVVRRGEQTWVVGDPALDAHLSSAMHQPVRVTPEANISHFDDGAVSLIGTASLDWCRRTLGVDADRRRVRPNLVLETSEPFVEETWLGRLISVGDVQLRVTARIERCRTVDLAQDGVAGTTRLLKALGATRDVCLGVYAEVVRPGRITLDDPVVPD